MTDCWRGMHTEHQDQIVLGGQTGWSAYNTLNGVDYTGASGGFLEAAAPGAQSNTIHGKARSSFTGALHFQNHYQNKKHNPLKKSHLVCKQQVLS